MRCSWPKTQLDIDYHDHEWGVPVHDDRQLFEFLILEGAQAGLSWHTILQKRPRYREVFDDFDVEKIARYDDVKVAALLVDAGIVRNRLKISAAIHNAQCFLEIKAKFGSFDHYLWRFVDGHPITNHWRTHAEIPVQTLHSDAISKDLISHGFKFVGSTICYALMQAIGMVNDHTVNCYRHAQLVNRLSPN
jgi:DNA-3-methyladenine glycosylase I